MIHTSNPPPNAHESASPPPLPGCPQPRYQSRALWLGWCLWLLVSWAINLTLDGPMVMPAVRWTLMSALMGLVVVWPLWRLSIARPAYPTLATLADLAFMLFIFQVLVIRMAIEWPVDHALLINGSMCTCGLAAGMCVDIGRRFGAMGRSLAMVLCLALPVVPGLMLVDGRSPMTLALSPMHAIWILAEPSTMVNARIIGGYLLTAAMMIVGLWILVRIWVGRLGY